jgi:hypothetical protein
MPGTSALGHVAIAALPTGGPAAPPQGEPHFIGKFTAPVFYRFRYNYIEADQTETNTHFIGKFTAPVFYRFAYNYTGSDYTTQPETNTHFIGKFTAPTHRVLPLYHENQDRLGTETNTHFIGKFTAPVHRVLPLYHENQDRLEPETNTHFIGKFTAPLFYRFAYNYTGADQTETNTHFIGKFQPSVHRVLPLYHENQDRLERESETYFIGKFTEPVFYRFRYNYLASDYSGPLPIQPETQPHFIGKFVQPKHFLLKELWSNADVNSSYNMALTAETVITALTGSTTISSTLQ